MGSMLLRTESLCVNLYGKEILREYFPGNQNGGAMGHYSEKPVPAKLFSHIPWREIMLFMDRLIFPGTEDTDWNKTILVVDQQHRFKDLRNQSNFYYQQRYNAFDADATISVSEDLASYEENRTGYLSKTKLVEIFRLKSLLDEPLIQLVERRK